MNKIKYFGIVAVVVIVSTFFIYGVNKKEAKYGSSMYVPAEAVFAEEKAPLNVYDVKERFEREILVNTNLHSSSILIIKRANRAFPVIEPILKAYGVPDDFKYLAVIESSLTNAVSPSGAKGVWQFMEPAAKENGMEVNEFVDERYHLEKATHAACKYLLKAKAKFGTWTLAAASYNAGMTGIANHLENQKVDNYYDLLLTEETSRYVFRILALKYIMESPKSYGFNISTTELYQLLPTKKVEVDSSITSLAQFAKTQGINYKILKLHNPWLRDKKLVNPTKKKYVIEIPTQGY
jgi:soluble lytic murein transglycosylase-like protein